MSVILTICIFILCLGLLYNIKIQSNHGTPILKSYSYMITHAKDKLYLCFTENVDRNRQLDVCTIISLLLEF